MERLDGFATIGATAGGGVDRQALTKGDREARVLLASLALERGFSVHQDPIANLFIRRNGRRNDLPAMLIGSHLDSQPTGGRFDGALGTLAAFEALETLEDAGVETARPVEVVAWTNEEGCRFSPGCMGSSAFAARVIPDSWFRLAANDGTVLADELGATLSSLPAAAKRPLGFPVFAYLELHIEQGPSLERENVPIGLVSGIQGTRWLEVVVNGQTAHAGTTALAYRRDPMRAVAAALATLHVTVMPQDPDARLTVGQMSLSPGAINAIPDSVRFTLDIRHPESTVIDRIAQFATETCRREAEAARCEISIAPLFDMPPAAFPKSMIATLAEAARLEGLSAGTMLSGAFHDALFLNRVAPSAMLFTPCRLGLSHNPSEYVRPEDVATGCQMLLSSTLKVLERA
jgi:N-carbamoyl-L-amino-acid hydrolase